MKDRLDELRQQYRHQRDDGREVALLRDAERGGRREHHHRQGEQELTDVHARRSQCQPP